MFLTRYSSDMGRQALVGPITSHIAGELRAQKSRHRWSLDWIADRSGLPRSTVDRALKGEAAISVEVLIPLCAAMQMDAAALMRDAREATS